MQLIEKFNTKREYFKCKTLSRLLKSVLSLEYLSINFGLIGNFYKEFFYDKMIQNELDLANVNITSKIAHIGSGPFPMTALYLAQKGYNVDCYDIDAKAVEDSTAFVANKNLAGNIKIYNVNYKKCNYDEYDLIILSLHIIDKEKIVQDIISSISSGKKIIFRNPRSILKLFYPVISFDRFKGNKMSYVRQIFFKESVIIEKRRCVMSDIKAKLSLNENKTYTLSDLKLGQSAIINKVCSHCLFGPLGIREGKKVTLESLHPFSGPMLLNIDNRQIAVSRHLAEGIELQKITDLRG